MTNPSSCPCLTVMMSGLTSPDSTSDVLHEHSSSINLHDLLHASTHRFHQVQELSGCSFSPNAVRHLLQPAMPCGHFEQPNSAMASSGTGPRRWRPRPAPLSPDGPSLGTETGPRRPRPRPAPRRPPRPRASDGVWLLDAGAASTPGGAPISILAVGVPATAASRPQSW